MHGPEIVSHEFPLGDQLTFLFAATILTVLILSSS